MRKRRTGFFLASTLTALSLIVAACGNGADEEGAYAADGEAAAGGRTDLHVAIGADAVSLDPHGTNDNPSAVVMRHIYNTLVYMDENMDIQPGLAESWEQIDDLTWEFQLRDGVYFHNGERLTASDVAFTFDRAGDVPVIDPIVGIIDEANTEVVDDLTVRLRSYEPFAPFLGHLAHPSASIINQVAVEYYGDDDFGRNPVGTGAFKLYSWDVGTQIELVRFDDYFGDLPHLKRITLRPITENAGRTIELETGGVDIALDPRHTHEYCVQGSYHKDQFLKIQCFFILHTSSVFKHSK